VVEVNYAGLDVHKDFVQACVIDEQGKTLLERRYETTSTGIKQLQTQMQQTNCVIESSTACFRIYDALQEANVKVRVAHPLQVKAIASAKIKTDKLDAHTLAQLERANLIPEAHLPDKQTRETRNLIREHASITREATRLKNRVRSLLLKQGFSTPKNLFTNQNKARTLQLVKGTTNTIIEQAFQRLLLLNQQKKSVDELIEQQAQQNPDAILLKTIPGFGWFTALLVAVETDGVQRFQDDRHLTSYAGLVPSTRQSGNTRHTGPISKQGNKLMRWALVQAAWRAVRESKRFKKLFVKASRKRGSKKAVVAVARKILTCAFFMLSRRQAFCENA
jgi:transposase